MLDDCRIYGTAWIEDRERKDERRCFESHRSTKSVRRRDDDPVTGRSSGGSVAHAGRRQRERSVHEGVDAAAADERSLGCQRHHVEFAGAD